MNLLSEHKSFAGCLHPVRVLNKYTNQVVVSNCGRCAYCMRQRAQRNELLLDIKTSEYSSLGCFVEFLTLTYHNDYIPLAEFKDNGSIELLPRDSVLTYTTVNGKVRSVGLPFKPVSYFHGMSLNQIDLLVKKTSSHIVFDGNRRVIPVLQSCDLRPFFKRLRQFLTYNYNYNETLHYYFVGEYGPKTFRPHWHIVLFHKSQQFRENLRHAISSCWRFGYTDAQHVTTSVSSYVASYVNSFTNLPLVLSNCPAFAPVSRFSSRFLESFFAKIFLEEKNRACYERRGFKFVDGFSARINGKDVPVCPPRSYIVRYFPKFCSGPVPSVDSSYRVIKALQGVPSCLARLGFLDVDFSSASGLRNISSYSKIIYFTFLEYYRKGVDMPIPLHNLYYYTRMSEYMPDSPSKPANKAFEGTLAIYRLLSVYRNFCRYYLMDSNGFVSSDLFKIRSSLRYISDFYQYFEKVRLRRFYDKLEKVYLSSQNSTIPYIYFYDCSSSYVFNSLTRDIISRDVPCADMLANLRASVYQFRTAYDAYDRFNRSNMKHKELNDANKLLLQHINSSF